MAAQMVRTGAPSDAVELLVALTCGMRQRVLTYNAASLVKVPRPACKKVALPTIEQCRTLLNAAAEHRFGAMVIVSLTMGLRIGEVSGLAWRDIDLDGRTLRVRRQLQWFHSDGGPDSNEETDASSLFR